MNLSEALHSLICRLSPVAGEDASREARLLLGHVMDIPIGGIAAALDETLPGHRLSVLEDMLQRRLEHEPLQYILGEWEFMGLPFFVKSGVLIPRPDTETLVEHALSLIKERRYTSALDLCCGTGCIGISICKLAGIEVICADISEDCILNARLNAQRIGVKPGFIKSDFFSALQGERFDIILSNPPYIRSSELSALAPELAYEPRLALDGGTDGLNSYRAISKGYARHLNPGGTLLLEVGAWQADEVEALFQAYAYTIKDLNGIDRVVCIKERPYEG